MTALTVTAHKENFAVLDIPSQPVRGNSRTDLGNSELQLQIPGLDAPENSGASVHDYFNYGGTFPLPAAKASETSKSAANEMAEPAKGIRGIIAREFVGIFPAGMTPDEMADRLGISILTARPRFSELSARGLIEKTSEKRPTTSLKPGAKAPRKFMAEVWRASALLLGNNSTPSIIPNPGIDGGTI